MSGWIQAAMQQNTKALYVGKLSLPADVIQLSWLYLFMVELMVQNTSKFISKLFLCLVFHEIKLKLVSNCFFASIKRYIKEELSLIKEWKKLLHKKKICTNSLKFAKVTRFFLLLFR
jgi:hypothetical protein